MNAKADKRRRDLAAIHAQAKTLGMDEDTRRALIERVSAGRTRSAADLTAGERADVLLAMGGGKRPPARAGRGPGRGALDRRAMLTKVEAQLADARLPWSYAEAILRRQRGIKERTVSCPIAQSTDAELRGVIAALARRAQRQAGKLRPAATQAIITAP